MFNIKVSIEQQARAVSEYAEHMGDTGFTAEDAHWATSVPVDRVEQILASLDNILELDGLYLSKDQVNEVEDVEFVKDVESAVWEFMKQNNSKNVIKFVNWLNGDL